VVFHRKDSFSRRFVKQLISPNIPKETIAFTVPLGTAKTQFLRVARPLGRALLGGIKQVIRKPKKSLITLATAPPAVGLLAFTPIGRKAVAQVFSPIKGFKRGQQTPEFISGVLEDIRGGKTPSGIPEGLKTAGLIGGGAAALGAGVVVAKKVKERFKSRDPLLGNVPLAPFPDTRKALAPVKQPVEEKPVVIEAMPKQQPIKIKNVLKNNINIKISKRKRFINQQLIIK